ncbi:hypothetical protein ACLB2K_025971 [Fragaria x ananassa]
MHPSKAPALDARYSFLINGVPRGSVTPNSGLRQGDPISPYLFLLCVKGLSALIADEVSKGVWHGLRVCEGAPTISNLFFADDSLLYARAFLQDCALVRQILKVYEEASGQQIRKEECIGGTKMLCVNQKQKEEAELGKAPSYAWRSILEGRDTLRNGIQRLIGDGMSTDVWADPWLMGENLSPFFSDIVSRVSDLFVSPRVWDVALLYNLFPAYIVHKIQALPASSKSHSDKWIWAPDRKGMFTIKSAYHIARTRVLEDHVMAPNPSAQLWNKI